MAGSYDMTDFDGISILPYLFARHVGDLKHVMTAEPAIRQFCDQSRPTKPLKQSLVARWPQACMSLLFLSARTLMPL